MFTSAPLLLLLALAPSVFCATELLQPDSVVIKPGETLTITCRVSGASITDSSSHYGTAWIRQPAGKSLEWINSIYYNGGINKKDSLKDKFVISRDTSSNTVILTGQNMQTEDTAVYYCAREPQSLVEEGTSFSGDKYTPAIDNLLQEFDERFTDFKAHHDTFQLYADPFSVDVESVPKHMQQSGWGLSASTTCGIYVGINLRESSFGPMQTVNNFKLDNRMSETYGGGENPLDYLAPISIRN
ncbi:uncharacterized protein LOC128616964 [Ictalurus furcatus]|uniref:uncharacterized protein LOC128616964 n=1 Tax=Ictalurus furcatus TaxID=66913 RepID=UPI00234FC877|nr:uncharacterized protein LOC128616964 [Ictalurus furcatus]